MKTAAKYRRSFTRIACVAALTASTCAAQADVDLPGECTFPEGITSTTDGTLFVGSMQYGSIYRIAPGAAAEIFVPDNANGPLSVLGVFADEPRNRLIACVADPGIAHTKVGDDRFGGKGGSGIRIYDLRSGKQEASADFPGGGFCNDIAVDANGAIFATDTFHGRLLRYTNGPMTVWAMGGLLADRPWTLNGIDYRTSDNSLYVGNQATGQIFKIGISKDGSPGKIETVETSRVLEIPDGIRFIDDNTLGVVEAGPSQYSTVSLTDGSVSEVAKNLAAPATFAAVKGKAWVTSAQGHQFWAADGDCSKATKPFRILETPAR